MKKGKLVVRANYLMFWCPACNAGHSVYVGPTGWSFNGNYEKPTLHPRLLLQKVDGRGGLYKCYSYVINGKIEFAPNSTHNLSGQVVNLPDYPSYEDL